MSAYHSTVHVLPAGLVPRFHCAHDNGAVSFRLVDPTEPFDRSPLYVTGTSSEILDLAVRLADAVTTYTQDQRGAA